RNSRRRLRRVLSRRLVCRNTRPGCRPFRRQGHNQSQSNRRNQQWAQNLRRSAPRERAGHYVNVILEEGPENGAKLSAACAEMCLPAGRCLRSHSADLRAMLFFWSDTGMKLPQTVRWATGIPWQWKVFIPIIGVLALSLVVVTLVLRTLEIENAQWILLAALGFAILLCFVLLSVLLVLVERPLQELMETIDRVRHGDLSTRVGFAKRDDDIGRLGRQFNEMVEQLNESRRKLEEFHQREMARAQHLATLGELATGLAHEIRNPLAGIAGVVDVMSKDLPANSPSRAVMGDVQKEIRHIQDILNDLLFYARPRPP